MFLNHHITSMIRIEENSSIYNLTQTTCDSGIHNSVYIISISFLATALIISVVHGLHNSDSYYLDEE